MPFQVVYSEYNRQPGVIKSFSAGEDFSSVCTVNITLTAIVNGDLFGHTVYWDQISGNPVTWTSPQDQLVVTYDYDPEDPGPGKDFDDKVFRFYIDKDSTSPYWPELFDDINVWGAPTDAQISQASILTSYAGPLACATPRCNQISIQHPANQQPSCISANLEMHWPRPDCMNEHGGVSKYHVEAYTPGIGWYTIAELPGNARYYTGLVPGASYRLRTFLNGQVASGGVVSCVKVANPTPATPIDTQTSSASVSQGGQITNYAVNDIRLIQCDDPEIEGPANTQTSSASVLLGGQITNYAVNEVILVTCPKDETEDGDNNMQTVASSVLLGGQITNYSVNVVYGSDIGG